MNGKKPNLNILLSSPHGDVEFSEYRDREFRIIYRPFLLSHSIYFYSKHKME